jgi:hypothetical protein
LDRTSSDLPVNEDHGPYGSPEQQRGCLTSLLAAIWIIAASLAAHIGQDGYHTPLLLKLMVTVGHTLAISTLLYPHRYRPIGVWLLCVPLALYALLGVMVMWFWN